MSIRAIDWAFKQKVGSMATKIVLIKLADNANDEGFCWPSFEYIAEQCECDRTTVKRQIRRLVEMGLVFVEHRKEDNTSLSNYYCLNLPPELQNVNGESGGSNGGGRGTAPPGGRGTVPPGWVHNAPRVGAQCPQG